MNLYFLVEGKRTESKIYPRWLSHLVPQLRRAGSFDEVTTFSYYLFSGEGYPSLLRTHLPNAIRDILSVARYDALIVCLDADEMSVAERGEEVNQAVLGSGIDLGAVKVHVIVQNRCIETWCLGNRRVISRNPQSQRLAEFLRFFDVASEDPELMGIHPDYSSHSPFHSDYLRHAFRGKAITYSKTNPGHACDSAFLDQLVLRTTTNPNDLRSFQAFLELCEDIRARLVNIPAIES